jgi:hypothetical protein
MTKYTVYPSDLTKVTQIASTLALLQTNYGEASVSQTSDPVTFLLTSPREDLQVEIRDLPGVHRVARVSKNIVWSTSTTKQEDGVRRYMVAATEGSDTQITEEFLRGKVEPGTWFTRVNSNGKDVVRGWGMLALGDEGKEKVREYNGVDGTLLFDSGSRGRIPKSNK